jgi:Tol biopolymer transport system component
MKFRTAIALLLLIVAASSPAAETLTRGNSLTVDASRNGQFVMDVAGELWMLPLAGGDATSVAQGQSEVRRPRWSPDARRIAYSASASQQRGIWVHDLDTSTTQRVSDGTTLDLHPAWHADGERLIFASDRRGTGFDLWEVDLPTGLQWRLSSRPGDETEPAWSADGRDLVYVYREGDEWSLVLRPLGGAEEVLVSSQSRLFGPSWRPDDSLIMYWQDSDDGLTLNMVILSEPRLVRRYADGEGYVPAPVSWLDRHRMFYTADGVIRQRLFNAWSSRTVHFRGQR